VRKVDLHSKKNDLRHLFSHIRIQHKLIYPYHSQSSLRTLPVEQNRGTGVFPRALPFSEKSPRGAILCDPRAFMHRTLRNPCRHAGACSPTARDVHTEMSDRVRFAKICESKSKVVVGSNRPHSQRRRIPSNQSDLSKTSPEHGRVFGLTPPSQTRANETTKL